MNPHRQHATTLHELFLSLWRHRGLVRQLVQREITARYRGSVLGIAWSFFNPALMLAVYTFVFSIVLKVRWGIGDDDNRGAFAIVLFVGMIVHGLFAEVANRAPTLILSNVSYVKRVVFPLEVLPWTAMGTALFQAGVSTTVLLLAQLALMHQLPWTALFFPFILLPLVLATMGLGWFLAALGVYVRDIGQAIGIVTTVLLFMSPIFFPVTALPERVQPFIYLNPLTFIIEESRKVLLFGEMPDWWGWLVAVFVGVAFAWAGFWWFQKTRRGFADVV